MRPLGDGCDLHVGNIVSKRVSPKLLVAFLNSRLLNWYYQTIALEVGRVMPQTDIETLGDLQIKCHSLGENIIGLVEDILAAKKRDPEAETTALERELDRHVYALYGLTKQEIALVEGSESK